MKNQEDDEITLRGSIEEPLHNDPFGGGGAYRYESRDIESQPQMDASRRLDRIPPLLDTPQHGFVTCLAACTFSSFTFGIGGFLFLLCVRGVFARIGVLLGCGAALIFSGGIYTIEGTTSGNEFYAILGVSAIIYGVGIIYYAIWTYRKEKFSISVQI
jgi:hypothetical protein